MYIEIVLTIYVILWAWGMYKPNTLRAYFKKKLKQTKIQIWELEFQRFQTKEAREELRLEYDRLKHKKEALIKQIEDEKKKGKMPEGDIKRLEDELVRIDVQIIKTEKGNEKADPEDPAYQQLNLEVFDKTISAYNVKLDEVRSLNILIKDYLKKEI
jgi:seryl-tRNA synthetase